MNKIFVIVCIFFVVGVFMLLSKNELRVSKNDIDTLYIEIAHKKIFIEIADTESKRVQGLSERAMLPEDSGMFFIFPHEDRYEFWMKNMNFPIDIIWIDKDFIVQDITKYAAPEAFPNTFTPRVPIQYVLEVNAGFADKNKIET